MARQKLASLRCQETETSFSLDKQPLTPYGTTHTDEQIARCSADSIQKLDKGSTEGGHREKRGLLTVPLFGELPSKGGVSGKKTDANTVGVYRARDIPPAAG